MKLQGHSNSLDTNVVDSQNQDFSIGDASVVIDILRNRLYEHKIRTTVQEYLSNSRDAMREVGKGNNFEVTVPTRLNPVFKVRDFGPGISPERMTNVFLKYGASTKRDTNEQTGGLGIGAKSAFSYTDSFTIVTFIDGTKRSYIAHIGCNNQGRLDLVTTDKTNEPNGTEIQVAVKNFDIEEFRTAIFRAIYFWEEKPTLKGELHPPTLVKGEKISDLLELIDRDLLPEYVRPYQSDSLAVIDGIVYEINSKLREKCPSLVELDNLAHSPQIILHFGNGVVEVAASREKIADSKLTVNALEKMGRKALLEAQTHISDAFGAVKSTPEYLKTYCKVSKYFNCDGFAKYGDYSIDRNRVSNPTFSKVAMTLVHCMGKYNRNKVDKITKVEFNPNGKSEIEIEHLDKLFFVSKSEGKLIQNKRIREFFKANTHMILIEQLDTVIPSLDKDGQPKLDKDKNAVFEPISYPKEFKQVVAELGAKEFHTSITYIDPPKAARVKIQREDASICLHVLDGSQYKHTTLANNTQKWIYVRLDQGGWPTKFKKEYMDQLNDYTKVSDDMRVCGLAEKACKTVEGDPNFMPIEEYLKNFKVTNTLILAAKHQLSKNSGFANIIQGLKDIEDKFLNEILEEYKNIYKSKLGTVPFILANLIAENQEVKDFKEADEKFGKLMKNEYPLVIDCGYSNNKKELVFYINAKHKARKGK